ncbi:MAG: nuclear transport factor 2 family protein [Actinobacteria bacterium]|nr:nuclear transport factor 2 family protein [Actinomycetota bacterium]
MEDQVKTNEQRARPLDRMDESEVADLLTGLMARMDPEEEYELRHEDYVMEMPQSILELRDGKIWRDTRYFAESFEAPGWRARWVEQMEPGEPAATPARSKPMVARRNEPDEHEMKRLVDRQWEKVRVGDFAGAHEIYADDCVVEWPQSGECIRGKENLLALREAYPARVEFELRRVIVRRNLCVSEYVIRYDGKPVNVISIMEFEGTKVVRETHYFADPFPPPEWRAQWVERMEGR